MCGFTYEGHKAEEELVEIKDKEGIWMDNQFLSLKKTKNRALLEADIQIDQLLDVR